MNSAGCIYICNVLIIYTIIIDSNLKRSYEFEGEMGGLGRVPMGRARGRNEVNMVLVYEILNTFELTLKKM